MDYIKSIRQKVGKDKIILNCAGVIIEKDGMILLQRRSDNGLWGLIGGLLEINETYEEAAYREAKEETGLEIELDYFLGIYHNHNMEWSNGDKAHTIGAYYKAHIKSGTIKKDEESLELEFFDPLHLPSLFAEDHREAIKAYLKGFKFPLLTENKKKD